MGRAALYYVQLVVGFMVCAVVVVLVISAAWWVVSGAW